MGGGGGGGTSFSAQGAPPSFDYANSQALQQLAVGGDIQSYALSDQDFQNRYPALQQAYQQYQANLGQQVGQVAQGGTGQADIMQGLANTIAGRQATPTTQNIQNIGSAAATAAQATQPIYNLGAAQAGLASPLIGMGQQQAGIGQGITGLGGQVAGMAATPYALGQQLLNQPITPQTQQQMMLSGLGTTAGALGAASLGQGMAGQAAAARQLGLNTVQYGQAMRGEAMQDIGQAASIAGQGGQLQGLGASTIGAGGQTMGLGGQQLTQAGGLYNTGAQTAATAGGLSSAAQQAQEQYGMDTSQMAANYGTMQNQQNMALMTNLANTATLFPKRPFGLGGTNMAQSELGQSGAYNSFQQANYATMNGIAFNQAQIAAQQQQLQAQQTAGMVGAGVSAVGSAAVIGASIAAITCHVARTIYGEHSPKWRVYRHWLMNKAPRSLRRAYLIHSVQWSAKVRSNWLLRAAVRFLMDRVTEGRIYV